jgi:ribonuclease HI
MPTDPALALRLKEMIERIEEGRSLDEAIDAAGVTRAQARELFSSMKRSLSQRSQPVPKRGAHALVAYADGGSRGNPGPAACAAILYDGEEELLRRARALGRATNNVAEYEGAVLALELCAQLDAREVTLRIDSELVVRQIQGRYKVKHAALKPYHARVLEMAGRFASFVVEHISRAQNAEADRLVNETLDGKGES